jgi:hypothetical protein
MESRAIIGAMGAEKLFGKGDMLYLPPDSAKLIRAQGALITDYEINSVVEFITNQCNPSYEMEICHQLSRETGSDFASGIDEDEELIQQCIEVIRSEQKASVSLLQRRLRLGYTRAALIMDELENRGIVGPSKGAEPRDILIDLDDESTGYTNNKTSAKEAQPAIKGFWNRVFGFSKPSETNIQSKPPSPPETPIERYVVCYCEHCGGAIEFDASGFEKGEIRAFECPHCNLETKLFVPNQLCQQCGVEFDCGQEDELCSVCREQNEREKGDDADLGLGIL